MREHQNERDTLFNSRQVEVDSNQLATLKVPSSQSVGR